MKQIVLLLMAVVLLGSCAKQSSVDEPIDKWNGYYKYLKAGEVIHTLWAGKHINVGTVIYGIDDDANFYVTYDCSSSGWMISETHNFAGDKKLMPLNKPGSPKIGHFPNSGYHSPRVSTFTYRVPLTSLPPCEEPGFVVASHCVVHSPANKTETAWAEGDFSFTDKDWGWYDVYYYNQPPNEFTIIYGTAYSNDSLNLYHLDMTNGTVTLIFREYVGGTSGTYDGAAYDVTSGMFFFTNYNTKELLVNPLKDEDPSFSSGTLIGTPASGAFYDGHFYYVDEEQNTINKVSFTSEWLIESEVVLSTIPLTVTVNDIAMSPAGDYLYMVGTVNDGGTEMITWNVQTDTYYTMSISVTSGVQIAYGSDGNLYAIAPIYEGSSSSMAYTVNTSDGILTEINEGDVIIIGFSISDMSTGPIM